MKNDLTVANRTKKSVLTTMLGEITKTPPKDKSVTSRRCPPMQQTERVLNALTVAVTNVDKKVSTNALSKTMTRCALENSLVKRCTENLAKEPTALFPPNEHVSKQMTGIHKKINMMVRHSPL